MSELAQPLLVRPRRRSTDQIRPWEMATLRTEPEPTVDTEALYRAALQEAETLLTETKQAIVELRETAQRKLDQESERVLSQAQAAGLEKGLAEARAQIEAERLALLEPLQALLAELPQAWERFCMTQAPAMTEVCIAAAERILHEQLTLEPERILTIVRAAITHVPQAQGLTVVVHPSDLPLLQGHVLTNNTTGEVQLTADPQMWRGGCRVESRQGVVDASHDGALLRLSDNLRGL